MKKIISLCFSLFILLSLCGCTPSDTTSEYSIIEIIEYEVEEDVSKENESTTNTDQVISNSSNNITNSTVDNNSSITSNSSSKDTNTSSEENDTNSTNTTSSAVTNTNSTESNSSTTMNNTSSTENNLSTSTNTSSTEDNTDTSTDNTGSTEDNHDTSTDNTGSTEDNPDTSTDNTGSTEDNPDISTDNTDSKEDDSPVIIETENIICISPENKSTVSLLNEDMTSYTSQKYTPAKMDEYFKGIDNFAPKSVQLTWNVSGKQPENYQIEVSLNRDMSQSVKYSSTKAELTLYNLFVGKTYYWRVLFNSGAETLGSKVFTFSTENHLPRTIYAEGVSNTRDIGGWKTASGKRVKQGMIYRGAKLNDITSDGIKTMVDELGIKMDLDLRNSSETGNKFVSPLGFNVSYCNISFPYYALGSTTSIDNTFNHEAIATAMGVLANPDNYPIYIHCSIGRDRTGTLVSLINGLLGVREEDLAKDYEISYFAGCFGENPISMKEMLPKFLTIPNYIKTYYGATYEDSVETFLLRIGVSQSDIDSIRSIMLE